MNNPEVTMHDPRPTSIGLDAHTKAVQAASLAITLATRVPVQLRSIGDQVIRSASSVAANLAEGHGRSGRDRLHIYRIAYGSAKEVDTHIRLLLSTGAVDRSRAARTLRLFDDVRARIRMLR